MSKTTTSLPLLGRRPFRVALVALAGRLFTLPVYTRLTGLLYWAPILGGLLAVFIALRRVPITRVDAVGLTRLGRKQLAWEQVTDAHARRVLGFGWVVLEHTDKKARFALDSEFANAVLQHSPESHPVRSALQGIRRVPRVPWVAWVVPLGLIVYLFARDVENARWLWMTGDKIESARAKYRRWAPPFFEDLEKANTIRAFQGPFSGEDAARFMENRVAWWAPNRRIGGVKWPDFYCGNWLTPECAAKVERAGIDVDWVGQLHRFGYWNIEAVGPRAAALRNNPVPDNTDLASLMIPDFDRLVQVGQVHLLTARRRGTLERALRDVTHLARLMYSTEHYFGVALANRVLRAEREMLDATAHATDVDVPSMEVIHAAGRAMPAYMAFFSAVTPPNLLQRAFKHGEHRFGRCAALTWNMHAFWRPFLRWTFPGVPDLSDGYARLDEIVEQSPCRLTATRGTWNAARVAAPPDFAGFVVSAALFSASWEVDWLVNVYDSESKTESSDSGTASED